MDSVNWVGFVMAESLACPIQFASLTLVT